MNKSEKLLSSEDQHLLLGCLLDTGALLMNCGAEISRIEDTLHRIAVAYGAEDINIFAITSSIVITLRFPGGEDLTQTRRILHSSSTDFRQLEMINELSRECAGAPLPAAQLQRRIRRISRIHKSSRAVYAGSILGAFSFTIFFGGSLPDGITAALFAVLICFLQNFFDRINLQTAASLLLTSLLGGTGIGLAVMLFPALNRDMIIIGDIMLLIPGIAMTNAIRNMMAGDTISGVMRLIESLVWAAALACGFMVSLWLTGGASEVSLLSIQKSVPIQLLTAFSGSLGFALLFGVRGRHIPVASAGGFLIWGVYLAGTAGGMNIFLASLLSSGFSAVYAEIAARLRKAPTTLFFITSIIPLVPGSTLYYSMSEAVRGNTVSASEYGMRTLLCALGIAAGISIVWSVRGYILTHLRAHRRAAKKPR